MSRTRKDRTAYRAVEPALMARKRERTYGEEWPDDPCVFCGKTRASHSSPGEMGEDRVVLCVGYTSETAMKRSARI